MMNEAYIYDALRTPVGKNHGKLSSVRADELLATVLRRLAEKNSFDPRLVEDVVGGCVTQTSEQGLNIIRQGVLAAGWPVSVPGVSVNRLCGSGQQAVTFAAMEVQSGQAELTVGCGTESMSRVPMGSDAGSFHPGLNERFDLVPQGVSAELIAEKWGFTREQIDDFSFQSHVKAAKAITEGVFEREIVPVMVGDEAVMQDEGPRLNPDREKMKKLKTVFKEDGVVTAGSSSQISDGAAALLIGNAAVGKRLKLKPRARLVATAQVGVDPTMMLTGPIPATELVLKKAGMTIDQIDLFEVNEAFATVCLAWQHETGASWDKVNVNGGAVALGHPLGATGARLLTTLLHELERRQQRFGLVTMCIGFGQGTATIIERVD